MAKENSSRQLSPEKYIRTRVRTLPIYKCLINSEWKESGLAAIIIARRHTTGNITLGIFLTDLYARGVKDTFFKFNISEDEFHQTAERASETNSIEVEYPLAHNIIYGANEFAEEHGFRIHRDFSLTQYILEEDTDEIEYIDIEFGKDGKPLVIDTGLY